MSNALQTQEPSMDEILASIRRIIEGGDERGSARLAPVVQAQTRLTDEAEEQGADEDLDPKARAFSEGLRDSQVSLPLWPEGPGKPANDRTAMVAHLKRETKARAADVDPDQASASIETDAASDASASSAIVDETRRGDPGSSAVIPAQVDTAPALTSMVGNDRPEEVSPAIRAARQSAQSLAARTERLIAVVAGMPAMPGSDDDIHFNEENASSLSASPAMSDALIASNEISEPRDDMFANSVALQESLRSLREDAFGEGAPDGIVARAQEALAVDAFAEFDEDEFANELRDRTSMLDAATPATEADIVEAAAPVSGEAAHERYPQDRAEPAAQNGAGTRTASSWVGGTLHPNLDVDLHQLISEEASLRVSTSFTDLTIAIRDEQMRSIDDTVQAMLRPMLQEWLDDNLPHMVERLVREEIERVARGGRR